MIEKLKLAGFRNFKEKLLAFSPSSTVIVGPNASGKTNILEAIFLLSTGKSFHARLEEEMIGDEADIARVTAKIRTAGNQPTKGIDNLGHESGRLEVVLTRGEIEIGENNFEKMPRKRLLVNGVPRRLIDFAGHLKVVLFGPWNLDLVTQSPLLRRRFLDDVLSQVDREYRRASLSYEKGLRQRNRLLLRIREENLSRSQLLFWDKLLIKNGDYISRQREEFIDYLNNLEFSLPLSNFQVSYDKSAISQARLEQYAEEEVAAATTLVGPHRDDFIFKIKSERGERERNLAGFGSRGEQRMGVLWLKLAELSFIESKTGERPTLLLDDIFSELDDNHRRVVVKAVENRQTIITTTDEYYLTGFKVMEKIVLGS